MPAPNPYPSEGQESTETDEWRETAESLMQAQLELAGQDARDAAYETAGKLRRGEEICAADLEAVRDAARHLIETAQMVSRNHPTTEELE